MEDRVDEASKLWAIIGEADLTEADLAQAWAQLFGSKRTWLTPVVVAAVVLLALGVLLPTLNSELALSLVVVFAGLVVLTTLFQRVARRAWIRQAFANVGGPTTFRVDDYGFTSESRLRQHRLAWAGLARALETPTAFLVYTTPQTVLIVPKRAFTDAEVATLSQLLPERVTPKALPKTGPFAAGAQRTLLLWLVLVVTFVLIWQFIGERAPSQRKRQNAAESATTPTTHGEASDVDSSP